MGGRNNLNIHVDVDGSKEAKRNLHGVAKEAKGVGGATHEMGNKAQAGSGKALAGLGKLMGILGVAGLIAAFGRGLIAVGKFFDNLKTRTDEAVKNVGDLRQSYGDLFEALDAFDEGSRRRITEDVTLMLAEKGVNKDIGLPIINEYTRQFYGQVKSGQISEDRYNEGLKGMLGYGARHGGSATTDLIQMMAGWGMTTGEQQGEFRRMVAKGAADSGLTDADLIQALSRGMPTIKAMNWTPQEAVANTAIIAQGEAGRIKKSLPGMTFQALSAPQLSNAEKYDISEEIAQDPKRLYEAVQAKSSQMNKQQQYRMLIDIYGSSAAAGVNKLINSSTGATQDSLRRAAGPEGIAAELDEERRRMGTMEARDARAKAISDYHSLDVTTNEQYQEDIREIGAEYQKKLQRREPVRQYWREVFRPKNFEKDHGAYRAWFDSLSPEEKEAIEQRFINPYGAAGSSNIDPFMSTWSGMSEEQRYEALTERMATPQANLTAPLPISEEFSEGQPGQTINNHYDHSIRNYPVGGTPLQREVGPRNTNDMAGYPPGLY